MGKNYTAVIILQYNNALDTINCIESVEKHNTASIKYIIVDNGSSAPNVVDEISQYINRRFTGQSAVIGDGDVTDPTLSHVTLLKSTTNDGYARGNNKGLELAYADDEIDSILILNNDILFVEDIIPQLLKDSETLPDCAIVSPLLYKKGLKEIDPNCARYQGRVRDTLIYNLLLFHVTSAISRATYVPLIPKTGYISTELISGSCILCKKSYFKGIGSFDPGTFLYCEENILWEKIKRTGRRNYVNTDIRCIHLGASTIKKQFSTQLIKKAFESQNYFVKNYMPHGRAKVILLKLTNVWVLAVFGIRNLIKRAEKIK